MALTRKPFAELVAGLRAGRGDVPISETAWVRIIEVTPGHWRLSFVHMVILGYRVKLLLVIGPADPCGLVSRRRIRF
jgi:hypothetical protein